MTTGFDEHWLDDQPQKPQMSLADKREKSWVWTRFYITIALLLIITGVGVIVSYSFMQDEDSGIVACKDMVERVGHPNKSENKTMTKEDRDRIRKPFADSSYADISVAGTNLVDTVYKADLNNTTTDGDLGAAMALLSEIHTNYANLQVACKNHGVELPAMGS